MNKRQESKTRTREHILDTAVALFTTEGILNTSTAHLAEVCGISHGSLFQHFGSREKLIFFAMERELKRIAVRLNSECSQPRDLEILLDQYLDILEQEEAFLSVVFRELPFFPFGLRRQVMTLETMVRNMFHLAAEAAVQCGDADPDGITPGLSAFFGTLYYYLCLRDLFSPEGSVIRTKRIEMRQVLFRSLAYRGEK